MVEGGINTCLAILNDIQSGRPVVLIQVLTHLIACIHIFSMIVGEWQNVRHHCEFDGADCKG